jgi:hypothetical protein
MLQPGEVAGGDVVAAELPGAVKQHANLRCWLHITHGLGVRAGSVLGGEVLDDLLLEEPGFIDEVEGTPSWAHTLRASITACGRAALVPARFTQSCGQLARA